jgi:hypothetical protein
MLADQRSDDGEVDGEEEHEEQLGRENVLGWPMHSCGNTAIKAEVGPTSGPTRRLSHFGRNERPVGDDVRRFDVHALFNKTS